MVTLVLPISSITSAVV